MKTMAGLLALAVLLGGCVAVPAYPDAAYYPGPAYYPAPAAGVYVAPPSVYFGGHYGYRHGYRGRYWR